MGNKWKEDPAKKGQRPTYGSMVSHTTDIVQQASIYDAVVVHVDTFEGRGFEARVTSDGSFYPAGFFLGEDEVNYQNAEVAAKSLLARKSLQMEQRLAEARK